MRRLHWQVYLGLILIVTSVVFYLVHYAIFRDSHHVFIFLIGDIAFVPVEVLLVTLIIHRLLTQREKRIMLEKLNMIIGVFFSEVGTQLLAYFSDFDHKVDQIRNDVLVRSDWSNEEFRDVSKRLRAYQYEVDIDRVGLEDLRDFLSAKRDFLLRLLENPNLLEHETFTDLLRAAFHLAEELVSREDLGQLPEPDREHLANDIKRIYTSLVHEWLSYMMYLKNSYPYLFSLAMRTNPFDQSASAVVQ